jgi:hypothetical protein
MMIWRLNIGRGPVQWLGPSNTHTLWPYWRKAERNNL